jgi:hypothetical protein
VGAGENAWQPEAISQAHGDGGGDSGGSSSENESNSETENESENESEKESENESENESGNDNWDEDNGYYDDFGGNEEDGHGDDDGDDDDDAMLAHQWFEGMSLEEAVAQMSTPQYKFGHPEHKALFSDLVNIYLTLHAWTCAHPGYEDIRDITFAVIHILPGFLSSLQRKFHENKRWDTGHAHTHPNTVQKLRYIAEPHHWFDNDGQRTFDIDAQDPMMYLRCLYRLCGTIKRMDVLVQPNLLPYKGGAQGINDGKIVTKCNTLMYRNMLGKVARTIEAVHGFENTASILTQPTFQDAQDTWQAKNPPAEANDQLQEVPDVHEAQAAAGQAMAALHETNLVAHDTLLAASAPITEDEFFQILPKLKKSSGAGFTGWNNTLLRAICTAHKSGKYARKNIVRLLNHVWSGDMTQRERAMWNASKAQLIPKPGSADKRPLNIGGCLYRTLNRLINTRVAIIVGPTLMPIQYATGVASGTEKVAAITQALMDNGHDAISIDLLNAFNLIPRRRVYNALLERCPILARHFALTHRGSSQAFLPNGKLLGYCERGVRQGDPLAGLLFCLGIHDLLVEARDCVAEAVGQDGASVALAYADDASFIVPKQFTIPDPHHPHKLPQLAQQILAIFANNGVQVNAGKTKVYSFDAQSPHNLVQDGDANGNAQYKPPEERGFRCVGVPIGHPEYVRKYVNDAFDSMSKLIEGDVPQGRFMYQRAAGQKQLHKQDIFAVLNYCISARPTYLIRNVHPAFTIPALQAFDRRMTDCLMTLLGIDPGEPNSRQLFERQRSIPRRFRGLGVPKLTEYDGAVVHVQYNNCSEIVQTFMMHLVPDDLIRGPQPDVKELHNALLGARDLVEIAPHLPNREQYMVSPTSIKLSLLFEKEVKAIHEELLNQDKRGAAAIWLSGRYDQAAAFLDYHGGSDGREHLTDDQFQQYTRVWCALPPYGGNVVQMQCACQNLMANRWHYLVCKRASRHRIAMHQAIVHLIYNHIKEFGGLNNNGDFIVADYVRKDKSLDPDGLCKIANMQGHRGYPGDSKVDILFRKNGDYKALDITIANPAADKYLKKHSDTLTEVAIRERIEVKNKKFLPILPPQDERNRFVVLAFEVTGRMDDSTKTFLKSLTSNPADFIWRKFQSLLSLAIARFIADEVRHGIDGTQYLDGQIIPDVNVPADVFQDAEEDDPPPGPPIDMYM